MIFVDFPQMLDWESDLLLRETQLAHREAVLCNREARLGLFAAFPSSQPAPHDSHEYAAARGQDSSNRAYSESGVAATLPAVTLAVQPNLVVSRVGCGNSSDIDGGGGLGDCGGGTGGIFCSSNNSGCNLTGESHCRSGGEATLNMLAVNSMFEKERLALLEEFAGYAIIMSDAACFFGLAILGC